MSGFRPHVVNDTYLSTAIWFACNTSIPDLYTAMSLRDLTGFAETAVAFSVGAANHRMKAFDVPPTVTVKALLRRLRRHGWHGDRACTLVLDTALDPSTNVESREIDVKSKVNSLAPSSSRAARTILLQVHSPKTADYRVDANETIILESDEPPPPPAASSSQTAVNLTDESEDREQPPPPAASSSQTAIDLTDEPEDRESTPRGAGHGAASDSSIDVGLDVARESVLGRMAPSENRVRVIFIDTESCCDADQANGFTPLKIEDGLFRQQCGRSVKDPGLDFICKWQWLKCYPYSLTTDVNLDSTKMAVDLRTLELQKHSLCDIVKFKEPRTWIRFAIDPRTRQSAQWFPDGLFNGGDTGHYFAGAILDPYKFTESDDSQCSLLMIDSLYGWTSGRLHFVNYLRLRVVASFALKLILDRKDARPNGCLVTDSSRFAAATDAALFRGMTNDEAKAAGIAFTVQELKRVIKFAQTMQKHSIHFVTPQMTPPPPDDVNLHRGPKQSDCNCGLWATMFICRFLQAPYRSLKHILDDNCSWLFTSPRLHGETQLDHADRLADAWRREHGEAALRVPVPGMNYIGSPMMDRIVLAMRKRFGAVAACARVVDACSTGQDELKCDRNVGFPSSGWIVVAGREPQRYKSATFDGSKMQLSLDEPAPYAVNVRQMVYLLRSEVEPTES